MGQAFQDMDNVQLAAYCIAMLAEYVQESWLAELRDIYAVPTSGETSMLLFLIDRISDTCPQGYTGLHSPVKCLDHSCCGRDKHFALQVELKCL